MTICRNGSCNRMINIRAAKCSRFDGSIQIFPAEEFNFIFVKSSSSLETSLSSHPQDEHDLRKS